MNKPFFSIYSKGKGYKGKEPFFYDPLKFDWVGPLENKWQTILNELSPLIKEHTTELAPYFYKPLIVKGNWKSLSFFFWSIKVLTNYKRFQNTIQILEKVPNIVSASISMLEPNTVLASHNGDTNAIIRCHLGLIIPGQLPECGLKVGPDMRSWEAGKVVLFCDAHEHSAFNNTSQSRYIIIFDVLRPEFVKKKLYVCAGVLAQLTLFYLAEKFKLVKKSSSTQVPTWIVCVVHKSVQILFMFIIVVKNIIDDMLLKISKVSHG